MTCCNSIVEINFSVHRRSHATLLKGTVVGFPGKEQVIDPLTELLRVKGRELLQAARQRPRSS